MHTSWLRESFLLPTSLKSRFCFFFLKWQHFIIYENLPNSMEVNGLGHKGFESNSCLKIDFPQGIALSPHTPNFVFLPSLHFSACILSLLYSNLKRTSSLLLSFHILLFQSCFLFFFNFWMYSTHAYHFLSLDICLCFEIPIKREESGNEFLSSKPISWKNSEHLQKEENCKCRKKTMLFSPSLCLSEMDTSSFCLSTSSRKSPNLSLGLNAPSLEILLYIFFLPHIWHHLYGEGNGNPLQYSCLENPMDGGAWCRLLSMGSQRVGHNWAISLHFVVEPVPSLSVC